MRYNSTRGSRPMATSSEVIFQGIAADGGLFIPEETPKLTLQELAACGKYEYAERAYEILGRFLTDFTADELQGCITRAYNSQKFSHGAITPLHKLDEQRSILELWHGPTFAFKDLALQILPQFMITAMTKLGVTGEVVILVATSGDTGKAALAGFEDVGSTRIIVFYPAEGVSTIQKCQMVTQTGSNTFVVAVEGNFDAAQRGVKEIFTDPHMISQLADCNKHFSSANSINWGRLVPQIVYYFSAYLDLVQAGRIALGDRINVVVPTGNFGNILAAYYARGMGLPIDRLITASNKNDVIAQFINTGVYDRRRPFFQTLSPSMDILVSSNLERLLYELTDRDAKLIKTWMMELATKGAYQVPARVLKSIQSIFWAGACTDQRTLTTIKSVYANYGYVVDPHTAVALDVYEQYVEQTQDSTHTVIASTASPLKFVESVTQALFGSEALVGMDEFELIKLLEERTGLTVPQGLQSLQRMPRRHKRKCLPQEMPQVVMELLK
ncbi:MAG: threonine synthase [Limnochordia bacterium]|jgi:threonine synthase|nr:threonine synthase [Limnochordia bacterium]